MLGNCFNPLTPEEVKSYQLRLTSRSRSRKRKAKLAGSTVKAPSRRRNKFGKSISPSVSASQTPKGSMRGSKIT